MSIKELYTVREIPHSLTYDWLLHKHYAKRIPSISYSYGIYNQNKILEGVCTFGKPVSPDLCNCICGKSFSNHVIELNRLILNDHNTINITSYFVSHCLKLLPKPKIIVSFSDTRMNHNGYIYQATNFLYTGKTKPQKDLKIKGTNLHSRHAYDYKNVETEYVDRTIKHRYVYFIGNKKELMIYKANFKLNILDYPKGNNQRYDTSYQTSNQGVMF